MSWLTDCVHTDCRHYIGEKPCKFKEFCPKCVHYDPMGKRILIIKLGAAGDALRTTPILRTFRELHGRCHVTWVTDQISYPLLQNNSLIDKLLILDYKTALYLAPQKFDIVYSVDKEPHALGLAMQVNSDLKLGFRLTEQGTMSVFNDEGAYPLWLGLSDPLKFKRNARTYQDVTFEMLRLPWKEQRYILEPTAEERAAARDKLAEIGGNNKPLIGLNTGAGPVFATKKWDEEKYVELARLLKENLDCTVLIMGGPAERERNDRVLAELGDLAVDAGCNNPLRVFAAMIAELDCLVTVDTMAMHLALAAEIPVVALFGPTAHAEVTMYGKGEKLIGVADCAPCYKAVCKEASPYVCMKSIEVQQVYEAVRRWL